MNGGSSSKIRLSFKFSPLHIDNLNSSGNGFGTPIGVIKLNVLDAYGLKNVEMMKKSDPYVKISLRGKICGRTHVVENDLNPVWNETIFAVVYSTNDRLDFHVYDWNNLSKDRSLGNHSFSLSELLEGKPEITPSALQIPTSNNDNNSNLQDGLDNNQIKQANAAIMKAKFRQDINIIRGMNGMVDVKCPLFFLENQTTKGTLHFDIKFYPIIQRPERNNSAEIHPISKEIKVDRKQSPTKDEVKEKITASVEPLNKAVQSNRKSMDLQWYDVKEHRKLYFVLTLFFSSYI